MPKMTNLLRKTFSPRHSRAWYAVSFLMVVYFAIRVVNAFTIQPYHNGFEFTEFLINFEGGFVRRGLLGQLLYEFCAATGLSPFPIIVLFSGAVFGAVFLILAVKFRQRGLNWWILLSPFMLGFSFYIIRKDYLCYLLILGIFYLLSHRGDRVLSLLAVFATMIFGLFVHEGFIFFGVPIAAAIMLSDSRVRGLKIAGLSIVVLTFLVLAYYKGDMDVARAINGSWNNILPPGEQLEFSLKNSIGAIGWDTFNTMKFHIRQNFHAIGLGWIGVFFRPFFALATYYFIMNFSAAFITDKVKAERARRILSRLYLFSLVCLLPMFTVLSCDYGRLYQYAVIATYGACLMFPAERLDFMPRFINAALDRFNGFLNRNIHPTKGLMVVLLLILCPSPAGFRVVFAILGSVAFVDCHEIFEIAAWLKDLIL